MIKPLSYLSPYLSLPLSLTPSLNSLSSSSSQFFILHDKQEQAMVTDNRQSHELCSGDQLSAVTGMELCGSISFPNASHVTDAPNFPFTGPSSVSLTLFKRDSHNKIKLFAKNVSVRTR